MVADAPSVQPQAWMNTGGEEYQTVLFHRERQHYRRHFQGSSGPQTCRYMYEYQFMTSLVPQLSLEATLFQSIALHFFFLPCRGVSAASLCRCVCVLDCAPQHVAADFVPAVRDQLPCCHMVHMQSSTSFNQPLAISYMRSFKTTLKHISAENFARDDVSKSDEVRCVTSEPELHKTCSGVVGAAAAKVGPGRHHVACWRHIFVEGAEREHLEHQSDQLTRSTASVQRRAVCGGRHH